MSERIRYSKFSDKGLSTSVQTFVHATNGAQYKVQLGLAGNWMIVDAADGNLIVKEGHHNQKHKAQLEARAALVSLGIDLTREKRKERTKAPETV